MTYRFYLIEDPVRQDLYPYAKGGPVTFTLPGQEVAGLFGDTGDLPITAGWYRSPLSFFHYLVNHGLPETNPIVQAANDEPVSVTEPAAQTVPWEGIAAALAGVAGLSLGALTVRRRLVAVARENH
jgi:hypothetical protein